MLRASASLRAALGLGIVFLMAVKPGAPGAFAAVGLALVAGVALASLSAGNRSVAQP
jgi:hypothetical protein